jgi:excisionase family DNA binding protein
MARSAVAQVERLLTVAEVAELLGTTERFPRRLIAERRIRFVRVGRHVRIPMSAVGEFIAGGACAFGQAGEGGLMADRRRRFGRIRQLPSGRWQARYRGPDGFDRPAPDTFDRKRDAQAWLVRKEAEILAGDWLDPDAGRVAFTEFAMAWVKERPNLRPATVDLYGYLLRQHILPTFGHRSLVAIREANVRAWRHTLLESGVSAVTAAKAYRLLRAILNTAADDGLIRRNPCRITGAGQE